MKLLSYKNCRVLTLQLFRFMAFFMTSSQAYSLDEFDDFSAKLPIITSASLLSQSVLTSPSAVTVIDKEMIAASGFVELSDVFRLVPGFIVAQTAGDVPAVISHGNGWEYPQGMQLLIDGRSTYSSTFSGIDWNTIGVHIEEIDYIEVVRGPAASAYGSNSFSGAINIVTKKPELDDKMQLRYRTGSADEQEFLLRHSGQLENFDYRLTASQRKNNGYEDYIEHRVEPGSRQEQFFDDYRDDRELTDLAFTSNIQLDRVNALWSRFTYTHGQAEMANLSPGWETGFYERDREINAWSANINWNHQISKSQELKVKVFHNYFDEDDLADSFLLSEMFMVDPAVIPLLIGEADQQIQFGERTSHSHRTDLEMQYSEVKDSGFQYVIGTGLRYDTVSSDIFFPEENRQTNTGQRFFGNMQYPINTYLTANLGGLYELNRIDDPRFSPRASLNIHITPFQTIRLGYSHAYRIPSLIEANMNANFYTRGGQILNDVFIANDDLEAEEITSLDIGYLGKLNSAPLSWELKAYREEYDNLIAFYTDYDTEYVFDDNLKRIGNVADSTMYGFEGELFYRPQKSTFIRFNFNIGHMSGELLSRVNQLPPQPATLIKNLSDRAPQSSYGLLLAKEIGSWQFSSGFYHVGEMKWDGKGDQVDSYNRVDASIRKTFKIANNQKLLLTFTGQNLTNNGYNEFSIDTDLKFETRYFASVALIID